MSRHVHAGGQLRNMHGWKRQHTDVRDLKLMTGRARVHLPPSARLDVLPPVRDQGQIGSCTANAGCAAFGYLHMLMGKSDPMFSRLSLYAATRHLEGTPLDEDSGCQVRDVFRAMRKYGVCLESTWPYIESKFSVTPPTEAAAEALDHQAVKYLVCETLTAVKHSLAIDGFPVIGGFTCYSSMFKSAVDMTGLIPVPVYGDTVEGGHCVMFVGYDDATQLVEFQNSWGISWGKQGHGFLPYDYFERNLASDFWTLRVGEM